MKSTTLTTQAFLALLAGVGCYISEQDPSKDRKPDENKKVPIDRNFENIHNKLLMRLIFFKLRRITPIFTIFQSLYLFYLSREPNKVNFPTHYALPFYLFSIFGSAWRYWCFRCLDKFFSFRLQVIEGHKIIQTGPYRYLAHPSYLGQFVNMIGVACATYGPCNVFLNTINANPIIKTTLLDRSFTVSKRSIAQALMCLPAYAVIKTVYELHSTRIPDEEEMLREHFGEEYDEFLSKRWRVIPFLY